MSVRHPLVVRLTPEPAALARSLRPWRRRDARLSALDPARLPALRAALDPDADDGGLDRLQLEEFPALIGAGLSRLGLPVRRLASPRAGACAVGAALRALGPDRPLAAVARFPGFHQRISDTLRQLAHHGLGAADLARAADALAGDRAEVLRDLAAVAASVAERWERQGRETTADRLRRLVDAPDAAFGDPSRWEPWWVLAGAEPDPLAALALRRVAAAGVAVTVAVEEVAGRPDVFADAAAWIAALDPAAAAPSAPEAAPGDGRDDGSGQLDLFALAADLGADLGAGADVEPAAEPAPAGGAAGPWWTGLFAPDGAPPAADAPIAVTRFAAPTPLAEAEWALRRAQARIAEGAMPHRIAVLARDEAVYAPRVEAAAARLGVPLDARRVVPLLQNAFVRWLGDLLDGLAAPHPRGLEAAVVSTYPDPGRDAAPRLLRALYALADDPEPWTACRSAAEAVGEPAAWLVAALAWRDDVLREPAGLPEWFHRLETLMQTPPLPDTVAGPQNPGAERDLRAQRTALATVSEAIATLDEESAAPWTLDRFARWAREQWEGVTTTLPGRPAGGVRLVSRPEDLGLVDHVFAVGLVEGTFPRRRREDPVLRDEDRAELAAALALGAPLPDSRAEARRERDAFVRLCAAARRSLAVSYPLETGDQEAIPTFYVEELSRRAGPALRDEGTLPAWIDDPAECRLPADLALAEAFRAPVEPPDGGGLRAPGDAAWRRPPADGVGPDEVADARDCPFRSGFRHRLRVFPRGASPAFRRLLDLPARAALSAAPDEAEARRRLQSARDEVLAELARDLAPWERTLWRSAADRLIGEWVADEFASRDLWLRADLGTAAPGLAVDDPARPLEVAGVRFTVRCDGWYDAAGRRVLRFYRADAPDQLGASAEDETVRLDTEAVRYGMALAMARRTFNKHVAAEIVTAGAGRHLLAWPGPPVLNRDGRRLRPVFIAGQEKKFFAAVSGELRRLAGELAAPTLRATPGPHCARCAYADLCRADHQQGEGARVDLGRRAAAPEGPGWAPEGYADAEDGPEADA